MIGMPNWIFSSTLTYWFAFIPRGLSMPLLRLNDQGRLCLKGAVENQLTETPLIKDVLLLIDTSGSMTGDKILQAKNGAIDFSKSATQSGYATGLAVFADRAAMVCDPTVKSATFEKRITAVRVGIVGGSTNLSAGLDLAAKFKELSAVVVVTDGQPDSCEDALRAASVLKERGIEILCIGTNDADKAFLDQLATRKELALHVEAENIRTSIGQATRLLLGAVR
jgi:Ca-activated chloride channel homolog